VHVYLPGTTDRSRRNANKKHGIAVPPVDDEGVAEPQALVLPAIKNQDGKHHLVITEFHLFSVNQS
jgi:hypothetical protein